MYIFNDNINKIKYFNNKYIFFHFEYYNFHVLKSLFIFEVMLAFDGEF